PTDNTFVLLETADVSRLPVTVKSRCQQLVCVAPDWDQSIQWLREQLPDEPQLETLLVLAHGAPCLALRLQQGGLLALWSTFMTQLAEVAEHRLSPLKVANGWSKVQVIQMLTGLQAIVKHLLIAKQTGTASHWTEKGFSRLLELSAETDVRQLHVFLEKCNQSLFLVSRKSGLNHELLVEDVLINWEKLFTTQRRHSAE
ncbi:MAG: DNA polymerase III subunit delta' C-terminal domain-containing protein, partial [Gammaproteobacteria bacterium]